MKQRLFVLLSLSFTILLVGCNQEPTEKVQAYEDNFEILGEERDALIGDVSETIYESIDRDHTDLEEIIVFPIDKLGNQVTPPAGRYRISTAEVGHTYAPESGRIVIYDENDKLLVDELYDYSYGVGSVTVDLNGSHTVHADGIDSLLLRPVETEFATDLHAGIYEVGRDIEAGAYEIMAELGFGYLQVFEEEKEPRVFEILNTSPVSNIKLDLEDGQKVKISGIALVHFFPAP